MINSYNFAIFVTWIAYTILNPLFTALFKTNKTNWGRFWSVWLLTTLITGVIAGFLILAPEQISAFITKFTEWIK